MSYPSPYEKSRDRETKIAIWILFSWFCFLGLLFIVELMRSEKYPPEEPKIAEPEETEYVPDYQDVGGEG